MELSTRDRGALKSTVIDRLAAIQSAIWACRRCDEDPRVETCLRQQTLVMPKEAKLLVVATAPPFQPGVQRKRPALSVHSDPRDRLRAFFVRTLGANWHHLVASGLAVLHAVKCAIVPKSREEDERQHQNPPPAVVSKCAPPHFAAEFWELAPPVVITLGTAARLAVRRTLGADAPNRLTLALKNVGDAEIFEVTSRGLRFSLVTSSHPFANAPRAHRDLLRAASLAGLVNDHASPSDWNLLRP